MKKVSKILITILFITLLASCSSSRRVTKSTQTKETEKTAVEVVKKKDKVYDDADAFFRKFRKNNQNLNSYTMDYINHYKGIAIEKMIEHGIPASITLAQGILESGNGRSELASKANNHFGIKCHKGWKGKKVYHDDDKRNECFRKYNNPEGSFEDHSIFLTTRGRYAFLFDFKKDNYKAWAKGLKKAGYATDKKYPSKLISFIETYHLYQYDKLVLKSKNKNYKIDKKEKLEFIIVYKGDTLYSIARQYNLTVEELKKINKLRSNNISIGQKLYIEK